MKLCNKCNTIKPFSSFYICKRRGHQSKCKDCEKAYKEKTKENDKKNKRNHYLKHQEKIKERTRQYQKKNRNTMRKSLFIRRPEQKVLHYFRVRLNSILDSKRQTRTSELIGCTPLFLKEYLESKFKKGMSWQNYGLYGWHIDHKIPCAKFDLTNDGDLRQCFHYTNLQPLWAKENCSKSDKILTPIQTQLLV